MIQLQKWRMLPHNGWMASTTSSYDHSSSFSIDRFSFQGFIQPDGQPVKVLNDLLSTHSYSRNAKAVDTIQEGEVAPLFRFQPSSPVPPDKRKKPTPAGVG